MIGYCKVQEPTVTYGQMNLIINTRNLWRDLVTWSRAYLISRVSGIGNTEDVFNRLYRVPVDFGNTVRLIFGDQIAEQYVQSLSETAVLYRELIEAQITGNVDMANEKVQELYKKADQRAIFLASINPFWDETQWKNLLHTFIIYSLDEITSILMGDSKNIDIFDRFLHLADIIGDYFAEGMFKYLTYSTQNKSSHL